MSYWKNEEEYKMSLVHFIERFVAHKTSIRLYTQKRIKDETGIRYNQYELVWKGMDWQVTEFYSEPEYFRTHPEVLPCPYSKANVVKVMSLDCRGDCTDEISIVIEFENK